MGEKYKTFADKKTPKENICQHISSCYKYTTPQSIQLSECLGPTICLVVDALMMKKSGPPFLLSFEWDHVPQEQ